MVMLPCNHTYHARCLKKWVRGNHETCPYCRGVISEQVLEKLRPFPEEATRTFVVDFQSNLDGERLIDLQRFMFTILNIQLLGIVSDSVQRVVDMSNVSPPAPPL